MERQRPQAGGSERSQDRALWRRLERVHIVGLGGYGARGLTRILRERGLEVSGSDQGASGVLEELERLGVLCHSGHDPRHLPEAVDLVVASAAVPSTNPELELAVRRGVPVWKYARAVARLLDGRDGIAVSGTHGKTTTTAMIATVLGAAGRSPGFLVGGDIPDLGGGARLGSGREFVIEACEFDRSFHHLTPETAIVTNVEDEHPDCYGGIAQVREAFLTFLERLPAEGRVVILQEAADELGLGSPGTRLRAGHETYALLAPGKCRSSRRPDWTVRLESHGPQGVSGRLEGRDTSLELSIPIPGQHNLLNAAAAAIVLIQRGVPGPVIREGLGRFHGVRRRFEVLYRGDITVVDDYAHHPTEVAAAIQAARFYFPEQRLRVVFQPHQAQRFRKFLTDFARVLEPADEVLLTEVFRVREKDTQTTSRDLERLLARRGTACGYLDDGASAAGRIQADARRGDVALFLGAGDISEAAHGLVESLRRNGRVGR